MVLFFIREYIRKREVANIFSSHFQKNTFIFHSFPYSESMRIFIFLSFFTILFSSCNLPILPSDSQEIVETTQSGTLSYQASLDPEVRLSLAKKRKSYISGIRKGDFYSLQNAPEEALSYYLQIQEKIPDDQVVRKKIAHVYFLLKDWKNSY